MFKSVNELYVWAKENHCHVYRYERGYAIYATNHPVHRNIGFVVDADGNFTIVDVSAYPWQDLEDFLDAVETEYEGVYNGKS
ncbi:hypothetical protein P9850_12150 [Anoxybacillus rupiensis]|uniref:Phage protein n=1 Tax=Anoxybacteroides rupiense TaxID=311460 RepID=A0ABD5IXP4_9BACL|nr:hypothetical protein [Anoxybacillus rupiensis]